MLWAEGAETLVHTQLPLGQYLLMKRVPLSQAGRAGVSAASLQRRHLLGRGLR